MGFYSSVYFFVSAWDGELQIEILLLRTQGTRKKHLKRESLRCVRSFTSSEREEELGGIFILNMHRCSFRLQSCTPSRPREPRALCWRRTWENRTPLFFKSPKEHDVPHPPTPIFQEASQACSLSGHCKCHQL